MPITRATLVSFSVALLSSISWGCSRPTVSSATDLPDLVWSQPVNQDGPVAVVSRVEKALAKLDEEVASLRIAVEGEKEEPGGESGVAAKLAYMVELDQHLRRAMGGEPDYSAGELEYWTEQVQTRIDEVTIQNTKRVKALLEGHTWFTDAQFGKGASQDGWLLVQHADSDPAFQQEVLQRMKPLAETGEVAVRHVAYLEDRVAVNLGQPQRYGTQGMCSGDEWQPFELEDPKMTDARRAGVGLQPLEEYGARFDCAGRKNKAAAAYENKDWGTCATLYAELASTLTGKFSAYWWFAAAECAAWGDDKNRVFEHLDRALNEGFPDADAIRDEPAFERLHDDSRWSGVLDRIAESS